MDNYIVFVEGELSVSHPTHPKFFSVRNNMLKVLPKTLNGDELVNFRWALQAASNVATGGRLRVELRATANRFTIVSSGFIFVVRPNTLTVKSFTTNVDGTSIVHTY